jgi:TonB family protein
MVEYSIGYADYPFTVEGTDRITPFFAGVRNSGVKGINGHLVEDKEEAFAGHPGRVYSVEFGGGYILKCRTLVLKNRLYMVLATTYGEKQAPPNVVQIYNDAASKFIDSFTLASGGGEEKDVGNRDPVSTPSPLPETSEGEVTRMKRQLEAAGEPVFGVCVEGKPCNSVKGKVIGGRVIKGEMVLPKAVSKPQPAYPPIARAARASGTVLVQVIVDESGKVIAAQAVSGNPLLQVAAVQAARGWQFTPTLLDGKAVKVTGVITFNFNLQ